jgi:hypothetical protein
MNVINIKKINLSNIFITLSTEKITKHKFITNAIEFHQIEHAYKFPSAYAPQLKELQC